MMFPLREFERLVFGNVWLKSFVTLTCFATAAVFAALVLLFLIKLSVWTFVTLGVVGLVAFVRYTVFGEEG